MSFFNRQVIRCKNCDEPILSTMAQIAIKTAICIRCQQKMPDYVPQHQAEAARIAAEKAMDDPSAYTVMEKVIPEDEFLEEVLGTDIMTSVDQNEGSPRRSRHPRVLVVQSEEKDDNNVKQQLKNTLGNLKKTWKKKSDLKKPKKP